MEYSKQPASVKAAKKIQTFSFSFLYIFVVQILSSFEMLHYVPPVDLQWPAK